MRDQLPDLRLVARELRRLLHLEAARARQVDRDVRNDPTRPRRHDDDAIRKEDGLVDLVRDEEHRLARRGPDAQELGLHEIPSLSVELCERDVQEADTRSGMEHTGDIYTL